MEGPWTLNLLTFNRTRSNALHNSITQDEKSNQDWHNANHQRCTNGSPIRCVLTNKVLYPNSQGFVRICTDERINKDEFIPVIDHVNDRRCGNDRRRHRQHNPKENPMHGATIHHCGFFHFPGRA